MAAFEFNLAFLLIEFLRRIKNTPGEKVGEEWVIGGETMSFLKLDPSFPFPYKGFSRGGGSEEPTIVPPDAVWSLSLRRVHGACIGSHFTSHLM